MLNYNKTITKFGYDNLLLESEDFVLLGRYPSPVRFGAVIIDKGINRRFYELSKKEIKQYNKLMQSYEQLLIDEYGASLINYYTLMLVDKDLHTHLFPRFDSATLDSNPGKILSIEENIYSAEKEFLAARDDLKMKLVEQLV